MTLTTCVDSTDTSLATSMRGLVNCGRCLSRKGSLFCLPQHLESYGADIFSRLAAADLLRGLAREQFIGRLRHHIDWVRIDPALNVAASAAAHHGDLASLTAMLNDLVDLPHPPRPPGPRGGRAA